MTTERRDVVDLGVAEPYYRPDLARVHHLGFGFHADACAPGILSLLEPIRRGEDIVLEIGCGSGLLTHYLLEAGHRVIATDASPAMLAIAREELHGAEDIRRLTLPDDPLPSAAAIVSVGHALSYLPSSAAIDRALVALAEALEPGGVLAIDICDLEWGRARSEQPSKGWAGDDWALVTEFETPSPDRYVRRMAVFTRTADGAWRRDDEMHDNVLIDTRTIPPLLAEHGVEATIGSAFGDEELPTGLKTVIGRKS